ncbi:MAG: hypothetical protein JWP89_1292 [Schlesneria sp.]|nr:hypothetical protein [Schlesneria sp.]
MKTVALLAVAAHVWVTLIVAPWHQLDEHVLPAATGVRECGDSPLVKRCSCGHHSYDRSSTATGDSKEQAPAQTPHAPDHDEHCPLCHVLSQPFASIVESPTVAYCELTEVLVATPAPQSSARFLCRPVSRGPPLI